MTDAASSQSGSDLAARLVEVAKSERLLVPTTRGVREIVEIATDARARLTLIELVRVQVDSGTNIVDVVVDALDDAGDTIESRVDATSATIELLDRSALPVSTAALLSGVGLLVGTGNRIGSVALLAAGALGLSIAAFGRIRLKAYENSGKIAAKKIRRLSGNTRTLS